MSFERVCLVNLKRRPDRLTNFRRCQQENGWQLPEPQIFEAIEGNKVGIPSFFTSGGGAWGCRCSHVEILQRAIMDDIKDVLVLEDDIYWHSDVWDKLDAFMRIVPADWDQLMLGGQHCAPAYTVQPGIQRCANTQRTHAYVIRGEAMKDLLKQWYTCQTHIDWTMGPWQAKWRVYCPEHFLFGQGGSKSDISGRTDERKIWNSASAKPVVWLDAPRDVVESLRSYGFHCGFERNEYGLDKGLCVVAGLQGRTQETRLQSWLGTINWEAAAEEGAVATVWHPQISLDLTRKAAITVVPIRGSTISECLAAAEATGLRLIRNYITTHVLVLQAPRKTVESLGGFHRGYWLDLTTGEDKGQQEAAELSGAAKQIRLQKWLVDVRTECERTRSVPLIWQQNITVADVVAAFPMRKVITITANTTEEVLAQWKKEIEQ